jgi:transcriptional regulator with XRE-family HTH domain
LAQRLGVGQDTISHYEKGQSQPNIVMTYYLAEILAVDVNYFFPIQANDADDDTLALLQSLSRVSYNYILQFIEHAARGQQQQRFFHSAPAIPPLPQVERPRSSPQPLPTQLTPFYGWRRYQSIHLIAVVGQWGIQNGTRDRTTYPPEKSGCATDAGNAH